MSSGSKKTKVGYWYRLGWHNILCQGGADAIVRMKYADREFWSGSVTSNTTLSIDKPTLLGGEKKEGGLVGDIDVMFGGEAQEPNPYLVYHSNLPIIPSYAGFGFLGGLPAWVAGVIASNWNQTVVDDGGLPVPAYRGVVSLVFKSFKYAAMNPYMKKLSVTVRRVPKTLGTTHAAIIIDGRHNANPAHIVYDVLTNTMWGLGFNGADIDTASFLEAAETLYNEGFGLSMAWTTEGTAEEFINLVLAHAGATLYPAPDTGEYTLKLLRDDYVVEDALLLDPSNILALRSFQRASPTDLTNEVTVEYHDPAQNKKAKVTVQNLAAIRSVGRVVRKVIEYPGIRDADLAARVAQRELITVSTPLSKVALDVNLVAWNLRPGSIFRLSWPKLNIDELVMRVVDIEYGDVRSGRITINAIEDQFALPLASYLIAVPPAWAELPNGLSDITVYKLLELPYFMLIQLFGEDYASYLADNRNFTGALAGRANGTWTGFELHENIGSGTYVYRETGGFAPWVGVTNAITRLPTDNVWPYTTFFDTETVTVGDFGVIDNEWVQVAAIDTVAMTVTVERGVLDTIPDAHSAGARLWLFNDDIAEDISVQRLAGEVVTYKLLPETGGEQLPITSATARSLTLAGRQERPYPPGNVKLNNEYFPVQLIDDVAVTWAHRDRTIQTADPIPWSSASVSLESGATYTAQFYRSSDNVLLHQQTGITAATKTVGEPEIGQETDIRLELFTVKGALNSYQKFIHSFLRIVTTDQYSLRVLADSPLGFWRMSDPASSTQVKDVSGNARHATANNLTFDAAGLLVPGSLNKAIDFNGSNGYAEVPYVAALAPTVAVTVELWVKFDSFPTGPTDVQSLVSKTKTGGYNIQIDNNTGNVEFIVRRNGAYGQAPFPRAGNLTTGVVYHIVGTFDGRYARTYLDGVLMATNDAGATYSIQYLTNNSLTIGAEAAATTGYDPAYPRVDGVIDEVSVYGVAIAASEVLARYKLGVNRLSYREDAFWDKTVLLLHMNGTDASTTFTDVKGKAVTANGNTQIDTAQSKFGGASGLFDGNGDYLSLAAHADFVLSSGDLTIECFVRFAAWSSSPHIFNLGTSVSNRICLYRNSTTGQLTLHLNANGTATDTTTGMALSTAAWYHVAVTRRGNIFRIFVDGVLKATVTSPGTFAAGNCSLAIGWQHFLALASDYVNGWIDEFRVTKACRYTKNFTVPVEAFPEQSAVVETSDPFWSDKTVLLLHMNGANGSTTFTDQKGKTVTPNGNAQISTAQSKFGGASALFDGAGDYLSIPHSADFNADGDFTIECWVRPAALGAPRCIARKGSNSGYTNGWNFAMGADGRVSLGVYGSSSSAASSAAALSAGTWAHVAGVKSGTTVLIFIDGLLSGTGSVTGPANNTDPVTIGRDPFVTARDWNGHIDELRVTQGVARYTDSFAPRKTAYPDA